MKKFDKSFDEYQLGDDRCMTVELHPQGIARYKDLGDNPLYYYYAFNYVGGDFFRKIYGYECDRFWDVQFEEKLVKCIDYYLTKLIDKKRYYFEEIEFTSSLFLSVIPWRRGIRPKHFKHFHRKEILKGSKCIARINLLDAPYMVDLDFEDGTVLTCRFMDYRKSKSFFKVHRSDLNAPKGSRRTRKKKSYEEQETTHIPSSKSAGALKTDAKCRSSSETQGTLPFISSKKVSPQLLDLRPRLKGLKQMREAREALSRDMVSK